ncbi:MAG: hypothetical protein Q7N87_01550 [Candidatus Uhrbacteria bacterium]|nr:hypothetical protein [Candidatus Uhrbacteria bacterium]
MICIGFVLATSVFLFVPISNVKAAACTFASVGTSDFNTAANWSCGVVPGNGDDVIIPTGTTTNMSAGPITVSTVTTTGTLNVLTQGLLATSTITISSGGRIDVGTGVVTSTGNFVNNGTLTTSAPTNGPPGILAVEGDLTHSGLGYFTTSRLKTRLSGSLNQTISGIASFSSLNMIKSAGTATLTTTGSTITINNGNDEVNGGFSTTGGGTLSLGDKNLTMTNLTPITIGAGTVVTSTTGNFTFNSPVTLSGSLGSNSSTINFADSLSVTNGGVIELGNGSLLTPSDTTVDNGSRVTVGAGSYTIRGTNSGTISFGSASGTVDTVSNYGTIAFGSGPTLMKFTISNYGTMYLSSATTTVTSYFQTFSTSTTYATSSSVIMVSNANFRIQGSALGAGTFDPSSSTVRVIGSSSSLLGAGPYNNVIIEKTGGTLTIGSDSDNIPVTINGTFDITNSAALANVRGNTLTVTGTTTNIGTVTSTTGTMTFNGIVTSTGSIGSNSGKTIFASTFQNNGVFTVGSGTATTSAAFINASTTNGGSGTLAIGDAWTHTGTFNPQSGTVKFSGTSAQTIPVTSLNNLDVRTTGGDASLNVNATSTGTTNVVSGSTLAVGNNTYTAVGLITNTGTLTRGATGKIVHTAEAARFSDSSGNQLTSYSIPGSVYFHVQDSNRNLLGGSVETIAISLATDPNAGSDAETVTLTETSASSGIFRNTSALSMVTSNVASLGNAQLELVATGSATGTYLDDQDSGDTTSTTATLTFVAASVPSSGCGGACDPYILKITPIVTQYQEYTTPQAPPVEPPPPSPSVPASLPSTLAPTPVPIPTILPSEASIISTTHSLSGKLIKLADDGNLATQNDSTVFFIAMNGARYAFSNEQSYFSWYKNFEPVEIVSSNALTALPLGNRVTYKPGVRMVKFRSNQKVYAVEKGGILRWIASENIAAQLYGSRWNDLIDDIADAFSSDYAFGMDILRAEDYDVAQAVKSVTTFGDTLK